MLNPSCKRSSQIWVLIDLNPYLLKPAGIFQHSMSFFVIDAMSGHSDHLSVRVRALSRPSFGCSRPLRTSFSYLTLVVHAQTHTHNLGLHGLLGLLSPRSSIYWFNGYYFRSYLISPPLILSYLISLSYLIILLFIVWMIVAPATPSRSVLVLSFVSNTGKHGPCAGLCTDRLGI